MNATAEPLILVFREKTGCRQYVFRKFGDLVTWVQRKPYRFERLRVQYYGADRLKKFDTEFRVPAMFAVAWLASHLNAEAAR